MIDRSLVTRAFQESWAVRTGMELFAVFLGLTILNPILASVFGWPSLLSPNGSWPTLVAGYVIVAGFIGYGLYVDRPWNRTEKGAVESEANQ